MFRKTLSIFILLNLCFIQNIFSEERLLYWEKIHVEAYLDELGDLEVIETQAIRFNGDWNGAYRKYDVGWGQKIKFLSLERQLEDGNWKLLKSGSIDEVDYYEYYPSDYEIKWRSRGVTDPPFKDKLILYRIKTKYQNILNHKLDGSYELDHDFAFSDRESNIREMEINFKFHENWKLPTKIQSQIDSLNLKFISSKELLPGEKFIIKIDLQFIGKNPEILSPSIIWIYLERFFHIIILIFVLSLFNYLIYLYAKQKGIFDDPKEISSWVEFEQLLGGVVPEHIALLSENGLVESWLTRLIFEKKIQIIKEKDESYIIRHLVPLNEFTERDQKILKEIFVLNKDTITNKEIKDFYRQKGDSFSLSASIRSIYEPDLIRMGIVENKTNHIEKIFAFLFETILKNAFIFFTFVIIMMVLYIALLSDTMSTNGISPGRLIFSTIVFLIATLVISLVEDTHYGFHDLNHNRKIFFVTRFLRSLIPGCIVIGFYFWSIELTDTFYYSLLGLIGIVSANHLLRESPLTHLKQIQSSLWALSLKEYLESKLLSDDVCDIPVTYVAYLPAFGLTFSVQYRIENRKKNDVFHLLPESISDIKSDSIEKSSNPQIGNTSISSTESGSSSSSPNIGAGGMFSGAGASASWSDIGNFSSATSYSPPSSSSSSSGSSSSGGGGGGGW
ncbi:MAG: hypothetical protein SH817_00845 [Leptospira sp.]|nr:hypothetical protein [Leptospira sp.]